MRKSCAFDLSLRFRETGGSVGSTKQRSWSQHFRLLIKKETTFFFLLFCFCGDLDSKSGGVRRTHQLLPFFDCGGEKVFRALIRSVMMMKMKKLLTQRSQLFV